MPDPHWRASASSRMRATVALEMLLKAATPAPSSAMARTGSSPNN